MIRKIIVFLSILFFIFLPVPASAATEGIGLSPAVQEVTLEERKRSVSFSVVLSNMTDKVVNLRLSTLDFGALNESGGVAFLGRTGQEVNTYGLRQWMSLERDNLSLASGQAEEITVTINNQDSLSPGGHYGAIIVSAANDGQLSGDMVSVVPAASTLVLLKKMGGEKFALNLENKKTNSSLVNLPKNVEFRFHNTGNTHVVPRGTVELTSPFGSVIASGVINEASSFVLPESYRIVNVPLSTFKQPWLPGRYKLTTTWRYDGTEQTATVVEYHWFLGKLAIYLLIIICTIFVLIMYIKYRRRPPVRSI